MRLFNRSAKRRAAQGFAAPNNVQRAQTQTFILEPILTPSGLVDGGDDTTDLAVLDVDAAYSTDSGIVDINLDAENTAPSDAELTTDGDSFQEPISDDTSSTLNMDVDGEPDEGIEDFDDFDMGDEEIEPIAFIYQADFESVELPVGSEESVESVDLSSNSPLGSTEFDIETNVEAELSIDVDDAVQSDIDAEVSEQNIDLTTVTGAEQTAEELPEGEASTDIEIPLIVSEEATPSVRFDSGVFTVGEAGEVGIDFLFDGGSYKGELAVFSLDGMEQFEPGSEAFIQEAARRALSDSELGHVIIRDRLEAAKFSGSLGESTNWNMGEYLGVKTFTMRPGDEFGIMLVPNGQVQTVFDNPAVNGAKLPLFSMATANPDDAFHVGQAADVTGDGSTFVMEDQRVDKGSDRDYNDLIFRVNGATGKAALLDNVIAPNKDWRQSELGQQITLNAISHADPGKELPGEPAHPAVPVPVVPATPVDQGGNGFSEPSGSEQGSLEPNPGGALPHTPTLIEASSTQDVIDQVSNVDSTDIYRVSSQQLVNAEISVLSGDASVSFLTPSGQVLGSQVLAHGTHSLAVPEGISGEVLVKVDSHAGSTATYVLKGFESKAPEPFNISVEFEGVSVGDSTSPSSSGGLTTSQQAVIQAAVRSIEPLIAQGLPSAIVDGKIIDDINIKVFINNLDGAGGTQAQTKIDFMRYDTLLPAQSIVQFDAADVAELERSGQLFSVAQHEILHALGFGNLWEAKGLVDYAGTPLAQYSGENAVAAFKELGGVTDAISLETQGAGSAGLHWNEDLFQDEVMTYDLGFQTDANGQVFSPISAVTLASLVDLGYRVNLNQATPGWGLLGGQQPKPGDLTPEQIEAFKQLAETNFGDPNEEFIYALMPEVDPSKVAPEIWAHAEKFWKNGQYYDWTRYQVQWGDTLSQIALDTMGSAHPDYYWWIANHNGIPNPDWIYKYDWIDIPQHRPNYEWEMEQERLRREEELRRRQEEEERIRREQEEAFQRDQDRIRQEEERRRLEAEAKQRELEEQERRLREEMERRRQEEERRKEEERIRELERQAEIARQQGKGGLDWYVAKSLPEFGPIDPFETRLTGETVGNLVPDDYYRFTLSRPGRIDARLMRLLADADLILYDVRNRPISYSMREGITDEQILVDLIPGTYLLRVNSPKGVTTDYELVVKFKHLLSRSEQGPPPGWRVGGGNGGGSGGGSGGSRGPLFADPRIQRIYDTALNNFAGPERAKANARISNLEAEKDQYEQDLQKLLEQMNAEQRQKIHSELDAVRDSTRSWVDDRANPIKSGVDSTTDWILGQIDSKIPSQVYEAWGIGDNLRRAKDDLKGKINEARSWLKNKIDGVQTLVKDAIWQFIEALKNAYRTGAEINGEIERLAQELKGKIDALVGGINNWVGEFKGKVTGYLQGLRHVGVDIPSVKDFWGRTIIPGFKWNFYDGVVEPLANSLANGVKSGMSSVANFAKGAVDYIKPRTQKVVAAIVDAIFGDKTAHLWNKIHGVDAQIAATRTDLEKALTKAGEVILWITRRIEALLTDPTERKRVLDALLRHGYKTAEEAYNFVKEELPKVRDQIIEEAKQAFEKAKKAFANTVRAWADRVLGNSSKRELEANLRLDKIIKGAADVRGGYKFELARDENFLYSVTTKPSIGIGLSTGKLGGSFEVGQQSGNVKIALQNLEAEVEGRLEGDLVLDTKIKYVFNYHSDEDMARLGVWAFREIPTPYDSVDPLLNLLIAQNYDSTEVSLNPYFTGELSSPWSVSQIDLSAINAVGTKANGNYYRKIGLAFNAQGGYVFDSPLQIGGELGGKLVFTAESSSNKLENLELEVETAPLAASFLANKLGISDINNKIDDFNAEVKSAGKAVSNIKFRIQLTDPMKVLSSYGSLTEKIIELSQSRGDVNETINSLLQAVYQTNHAISYKVEAEATQSLYINAEAGIHLGGKIGLKDTSAQERVLYQK